MRGVHASSVQRGARPGMSKYDVRIPSENWLSSSGSYDGSSRGRACTAAGASAKVWLRHIQPGSAARGPVSPHECALRRGCRWQVPKYQTPRVK